MEIDGFNSDFEDEFNDYDITQCYDKIEYGAKDIFLLASDLKTYRQNIIISVKDILYISEEEIECLLKIYKWNKDKLINDWMTNMNKVRKECGVTERETKELKRKRKIKCSTAFCGSYNLSDVFALTCKHFFCQNCWKQMLSVSIKDGQSCLNMKCQKNDCNECIPRTIFFKFIDKDEKLKYEEWTNNKFVQYNKNLKWCVNKKCNYIVQKKNSLSKVNCMCGQSYCFYCNEENHYPLECNLVKKWKNKSSNDKETETWIQAMTKECPNCHVRIEKDRFCNHMICSSCSYHFCWLCKGSWKEHGSKTGGYFKCNIYDDNVKKGKKYDEESIIEKKQKLLQKYMFYFNRYTHQKQGIVDIVKKEHMILENSYLCDIFDIIIKSRTVLKWSYVISYYMKSSKEKGLFEFQQGMLDNLVEQLHDLIENQDLKTNKYVIVSMSKSLENFRNELSNTIDNGNFDFLILEEADEHTDNWSCVSCSCNNTSDAALCKMCGACSKHGERECKPCRSTNEF